MLWNGYDVHVQRVHDKIMILSYKFINFRKMCAHILSAMAQLCVFIQSINLFGMEGAGIGGKGKIERKKKILIHSKISSVQVRRKMFREKA